MTNIDAETIRSLVLMLPEIAAWPDARTVLARVNDPVKLDWQLPALAARSLGADERVTSTAAAAVACLQGSIILVDDMLDQDPRGQYHQLGTGPTANLGLAFEAAALALIDQAPVPAERRGAAAITLAQAALGTAYGQSLDVANLQGEEAYWRVVRAKSTPFYGAILKVGAQLAGAGPEAAQGLYDTGVLLGEIIQIFDDLIDAFETPANPDWQEGRNNLALLFARTASHPQQARLLELLGHVEDPARLAEAQQILINSGAVSYCVYLMMQRYKAGCNLVSRLDLVDPAPMLDALGRQMLPLIAWLEHLGLPVPDSLRGARV